MGGFGVASGLCNADFLQEYHSHLSQRGILVQ